MIDDYNQFLEDNFDADILDKEQIQEVLDLLLTHPLQAQIRLQAFRKEAWAAEQERRDRESDEYIDFMVNEYGVDRFPSAQAGHLAWHAMKARKAA